MKEERLQLIPQKYKGSWDHYVKLYANKRDNLEEIDKFLYLYNLPRLNHKEIENLNRLVISKEIETEIKNPQQTKTHGQMASLVNPIL